MEQKISPVPCCSMKRKNVGNLRTNFDLFTEEKDFAVFAEAAVAAERIYRIDPAACAMNCRRAMECAVKRKSGNSKAR